MNLIYGFDFEFPVQHPPQWCSVFRSPTMESYATEVPSSDMWFQGVGQKLKAETITLLAGLRSEL